MKLTAFVISIGLALACMAHAGKKDASYLIGTWTWHHLRHEMEITYNADGTYERRSSTMANGGAIQLQRGTWKLKGNNLIETPSKKGSEPISSVIMFKSKDRFELDDFMTFERVR